VGDPRPEEAILGGYRDGIGEGMFATDGSSTRRACLSLVAATVALAAAVLLPTVASAAIVACPRAASGSARCLAEAVGTGTTSPTGLSPAQIRSAYSWPTKSTAGAGETIAIVDANDDPSAEADLAAFDHQYGLPACTTANGCFTKVDASGGTNYPPFNNGWAFEISIDVQWAHAVAPGAKILLVEAQSESGDHLFRAEDYAKTHARYVSNSWIGNESATESKDDSHFVQHGVSFFFSSGDLGASCGAWCPGYPSVSPNVVSVGGTQLNYDAAGNLVSETAWSGGGGGCSRYERANLAQSAFAGYAQVGCAGQRATPDVAADSAAASAVSVYDSNPFGGQTGNWFAAYGTSVATPLWAARSADAGIVVDAPLVYASTLTYRDVTNGNNGAPCLVGYDLCAGRGSWIGTKP
jgi:subtilase family serine protease